MFDLNNDKHDCTFNRRVVMLRKIYLEPNAMICKQTLLTRVAGGKFRMSLEQFRKQYKFFVSTFDMLFVRSLFT